MRRIFKSAGVKVLIFVICITLFFFSLHLSNRDDNITSVNNDVREVKYTVLEDGNKVNISNAVSRNKKTKDFEIANTKIVYKNGMSELTADITNTSNKTTEIYFTIIFIESVSHKKVEKDIYVGNLEANETRSVYLNFEEDVSNTASVRYEFHKRK